MWAFTSGVRCLRACGELAEEPFRGNGLRQQPECGERQPSGEKAGAELPGGERYEDVLKDPRVDIVNSVAPTGYAEHGIAAAEAGKHILIEKPMVISRRKPSALRCRRAGRDQERRELRAAMESAV